MKRFKCSFCDTTTPHIGERQVEAGWGRAKGKMNGLKVDVIHCPKHTDKFLATLVDCGELAIRIKGGRG